LTQVKQPIKLCGNHYEFKFQAVDLTEAPDLEVIMMEVAANLVDSAAAATASVVKMEVCEVYLNILNKP
jgi:hypothetical protein